MGEFVQLHFQSKARLRGAMPALRTTRGFIGEDAQRLKFIILNRIRDCLQRAGIVGAGNAIAAISPAVEMGTEVHRGNRPVALHPRLDPHQHGVAAAMGIKYLFAIEGDLHRPPRDHRQLSRDDLMRKGISLTAKPTAIGCGDNANATARNTKHLLQGAVDVVRRLGG